jgi:hypothetical protein
VLVITFTAPNRPVSINESSRLHWAERRRRLKPWHDLALAAYKHADADDKASLADRRIRVHVTLPFARAGRRDPHNYSSTVLKTIVDGLIQAGMAPDDTPEFVETREPRLRVDRENTVLIYLEPLEPISEWTGEYEGDLW